MPLVTLKNGMVVNTDDLNWSPSAGGGTMYQSTRPNAFPGLSTRSVQTVPVDTMTGKPLMGFEQAATTGSAFGGGWGSTGFVLPGMNADSRTAMLPYPPDTPPPAQGPSQFALMNQRDRIEDRPAPQVAQAPQTVDAANALDMSFYGLTPSAPANNSALQAIDQLTGSGRSTAQPFPLMSFNRPTNPQAAAQQQTLPRARPDFVQPFTPSQNLRGPASVPPSSAGASITVRKGDTASALAKQLGMSTQQFATAYGLKNPDKIYAGQTLTRGMAAAPPSRAITPIQTPTSRGSLVTALKRPQETRAQRFTNLDAFGNII